MIEYIKHQQLSTIIYQTKRDEIINKSSISVIHDLCMKHLFSYEGYKKAIKKQLGFQYKIPIYINYHIQLIPTERVKNYENIWLNYYLISEINNLGIKSEVIFYSGRKLIVETKYHILMKQIKRLEQIILYASKHFHV